MPKTITLRLDDDTYGLFSDFAKYDNRTISNMIETATKKHLEECLFVDRTEMKAIKRDKKLLRKLKKGSLSAKHKKGRFAESIPNF